MDRGIRNIDIRRRDLLAFAARLLDLLHIPNTEGRPTQLRPNPSPGLFLPDNLAISEALDVLHELAGHVDLAGVGIGELDDRADLRVELALCAIRTSQLLL